MLANMERMQIVATAEDGAKQTREDLQKLSEEKETLQAKLDTMNKQAITRSPLFTIQSLLSLVRSNLHWHPEPCTSQLMK